MNKKMLFIVSVIGSLACFSSTAYSHGEGAPQYGGIVEFKYHMDFELVREESGASLYIHDHGEPYKTEGLTGQVLILADGVKHEAPLAPAGAGKLSLTDKSIPDGAKIVVTITDPQKGVMTVRYSL